MHLLFNHIPAGPCSIYFGLGVVRHVANMLIFLMMLSSKGSGLWMQKNKGCAFVNDNVKQKSMKWRAEPSCYSVQGRESLDYQRKTHVNYGLQFKRALAFIINYHYSHKEEKHV